MKVRVRIFISGKVQGVYFRSYTKREATRRNVKGWVRNLPDGRVEAVLEGTGTNVKRVIEFVRQGPPQADVEDVTVLWEEHKGEFQDFKIRYR